MSNEQEIIDELQECLDIGDNDRIALYPEEVRMCIDALEKQIKKKVERYSCNTIGEMTFNCPSCNLEYYVTDYEDFNYCPNCGQKIDWRVDGKKLALGYLKVGDHFRLEGKEYKAGRVIENTNGYVACVDKDKKVRRIYIDTLVEKVGGIDEYDRE